MFTKNFPAKYTQILLVALVLILAGIFLLIMFKSQENNINDQVNNQEQNGSGNLSDENRINDGVMNDATKKAEVQTPLTVEQMKAAEEKVENPTPLTQEQLEQAFKKN